MNKYLISIEGNIGSGKSTLIKLLRHNVKKNNIEFVDEPVEEWATITDDDGKNILTKFYENQEKYSFAFQMMAYISRLNKLLNAFKNNNSYVITERSMTTDKYVFAKMLYDSGKMDMCEYQIYNKWFDAFNKDTEVTHVVYVKTKPSLCSERIHKRKRIGEDEIPQSYLDDCHHYHENMINELMKRGVKVLELDGNENVFDESVAEHWMRSIEKFIDHKESGDDETHRNYHEL